MMVLTSVYLSVSSSLPSTANIKPVELWLLFNLAYPFLVIITNTLLEVFIIESALNSKDLFQKRKVKKIKVVPDKLKVHQDSSLTKLVMKGISLYVNPLLYMVTSIGYFVFQKNNFQKLKYYNYLFYFDIKDFCNKKKL